MILQHVAQSIHRVLKPPASTFHSDAFGYSDLYIVDMIAIQQWFEN